MIKNRAMNSRTSDDWSDEMIEKFVREMNMMMLAVHHVRSKRDDVHPGIYDSMSSGKRLKTELLEDIWTVFKYRDFLIPDREVCHLSKPFVLPLDPDIEGDTAGN